MKIWLRIVVVGLALTVGHGVSAGTSAEPLAIVQKLQQPTWVERGGARLPLYPAMELTAGDRLITSEAGKLLLRFADGSDVQIGSSARIELRELAMAAGDVTLSADVSAAVEPVADELFRGVLEVLKGAFRFTTTPAGLGRQRAIDISVGEMATIGIRGTDVWGKADPGGDFVVLIEGQISVDRQGTPTMTMADPQTIYRVPAGAVDGQVNPVNPDDLQRWAMETQLDSGQGVIASDGLYVVTLASMGREDYAASLLADYQQRGYAVSLESADVNGARWHRLQVAGFLTRADASHFSEAIRTQFPDLQPWMMRRP